MREDKITDEKSRPFGEFCDILIRNAYILTLDEKRRIFPMGAVAIKRNTIVGVGPEREIVPLFRARCVIDAAGAPIHPGFVDAHYHTTLHLARGVVSDNPDAWPPILSATIMARLVLPTPRGPSTTM